MRSVAVILVFLVAANVGLSASRFIAREIEIHGGEVVDGLAKGGPSPPDCCNKCGACDRRPVEFARCSCLDLVTECHPSCQRCVQAGQDGDTPLYQCLDMNFMSYCACHTSCDNNPTTA